MARAALERDFEGMYRVLDEAASVDLPAGGSVAAVRAGLERGRALLLFASSGDGDPHAFWLERDALEHRRVPTSDLLGPWRVRVAGLTALYVIPGGVAAARQLHAQVQVPVGYLPYAGLLARTASIPAGGAPWVVADPTLDLPFARREGQSVAGLLPGARSVFGGEARRDVVLDALRNAPILHFAGHGSLDAASPWDAYLALAGGGRLTVGDVLTTPLPGGLVVLSGCETARTVELGAEHLGLADAFVLAGARAVIAADRPIDDAGTRAFFERFYQAGGAVHPGAALKIAAAQEPEGAAFRLVGRP